MSYKYRIQINPFLSKGTYTSDQHFSHLTVYRRDDRVALVYIILLPLIVLVVF